MDSNKEINDREKIAKQIAKTSESIRKKYRALKTGKMEEDIALERHFKPVIEPLKQIIENTAGEEHVVSKIENRTFPPDEEEIAEPKWKRKRSDVSFDTSLLTSTPVLKRPRIAPRRMNDASKILQPRELSHEYSHALPVEDIFETTNDSLATSVRNEMQTREGREKMRDQLGPLSQKYIGAVLSGDRELGIDNVFGVRIDRDGIMFGSKHFDVDKDDTIIIDGVRYAGTPGLYELIFKRIPDEDVYTETDMQKYKSMLLATNAHTRNYGEGERVMGNRGHKYKHIIAPLFKVESKKKSGRGLPRAMTLNDNAIDYVHWNDPNELVDRLRLLDASHQAGHNAHDNEMLSIIEELREAGLIIN
jgi:hypothetical protein